MILLHLVPMVLRIPTLEFATSSKKKWWIWLRSPLLSPMSKSKLLAYISFNLLNFEFFLSAWYFCQIKILCCIHVNQYAKSTLLAEIFSMVKNEFKEIVFSRLETLYTTYSEKLSSWIGIIWMAQVTFFHEKFRKVGYQHYSFTDIVAKLYHSTPPNRIQNDVTTLKIF